MGEAIGLGERRARDLGRAGEAPRGVHDPAVGQVGAEGEQRHVDVARVAHAHAEHLGRRRGLERRRGCRSSGRRRGKYHSTPFAGFTVYNAQHEELLEEVAPLFEEETGIEVKLRSGKDLELANQLVQEGDASPADVFLTENSPAMTLVDNAGLFAPVDQETLDLIPPQYVPSDQSWLGFIARSTVLVYNTDAGREDELPDLADGPRRAGVGRPGRVLPDRRGLPGDRQRGRRDRGRGRGDGVDPEPRRQRRPCCENNLVVMKAVNDGEVDAGIIYHYYWYRDQKEAGENSDSSQLHFFGNQDPGAFVSVSGAGVLASSDKQEDAQEFVKFLAGEEGQQAIADSYALEYPSTPPSPSTRRSSRSAS